jgi:hypothetical protein
MLSIGDSVWIQNTKIESEMEEEMFLLILEKEEKLYKGIV